MTIDDVITGILDREGRDYTNDPIDQGGPTKFGITLADLRDWRYDQTLTADAVAHLTELEARAIYRKRYLADPGFDQIPDAWMQNFLADVGVLEGPATAIRMAQRAVHVPQDGVLGPVTLAALQAADRDHLRRDLIWLRLSHLVECALADVPADVQAGTQLKFLRGWINRACVLL